MIITNLQLILQRAARKAELERHGRLQRRWDKMDPDNRPARPALLAPEGSAERNLVYYATRETPLVNEIFEEKGHLQTGEPGANDRLRAIVASMLSRYRKPYHLSYYVIGELSTNDGTPAGFRTLAARTEFSLRGL